MTGDGFSSSLTQQAIDFLRSRFPALPTVGVILGSGLGRFADQRPVLAAIPYTEIPGFTACSAAGHAGHLVLTDRCGPRMAILQGRVHRYEGHSLETVTRPVRVLAGLGVKTLIVTCAAGALDDAQPGTLLLIEDHLNLMGDNPLAGAGFQFVEMARAYDPDLLGQAEGAARAAGLPVRRGILAAVTGPSYETAAEAAMLGRLGAHAVSMSVVPEVIVARALGLRVLGLALLTNRAGAPLSQQQGHERVVAEAERRAASVGAVLEGVIRRL